jgi:hypothetical protein
MACVPVHTFVEAALMLIAGVMVGFTVKVIESVFVHPVAVVVAVTLYTVVAVGLAVGLLEVDELRCVAGDHKYVSPVVEVEPIDVELPLHILLLPPALTVGKGFTLIVSAFEVAVDGDTQVDELVSTQVIISLLFSKVSLNVALFLPTLVPFFFH